MKVKTMRGWKKSLGVWIVSSLVVLGVSCCGKSGSGADANTIKIGGLFELTGAVANYGTSGQKGTQLAVEQLNAKGGVNGKKLELVSADNKSEPSEAGNQATKLITKDKVSVIVGPCTYGSGYPSGHRK